MHYGSDKIDSNNRSRAPHATQRKASYILVQPVLVDDHSGEAGCRTKEATVSYYPEMALGSIPVFSRRASIAPNMTSSASSLAVLIVQLKSLRDLGICVDGPKPVPSHIRRMNFMDSAG